jgi:phage shock protein E
MLQPDILPLDKIREILFGSPASSSLILDVRKHQEYLQGHVEKSLHIPHDELSYRLNELNCDLNCAIFVYCASGVRSQYAKDFLVQSGYTNVYNAGGFSEFSKLFN